MSDESIESLTWGDLLEVLTELKEIDSERLKESVCVTDFGGSEVYPTKIMRDKRGDIFLQEGA